MTPSENGDGTYWRLTGPPGGPYYARPIDLNPLKSMFEAWDRKADEAYHELMTHWATEDSRFCSDHAPEGAEAVSHLHTDEPLICDRAECWEQLRTHLSEEGVERVLEALDRYTLTGEGDCRVLDVWWTTISGHMGCDDADPDQKRRFDSFIERRQQERSNGDA